MRVETTVSHISYNSASAMPLKRVDKKLSWCVFRHRQDHLKSKRSSSTHRLEAATHDINFGDPPENSTPVLSQVDGKVEEEDFGPSCCCCYTGVGELTVASGSSLPCTDGGCLKDATNPSSVLSNSIEDTPGKSDPCRRTHLTVASTSLPSSPAIPPTVTSTFQVQPPPAPAMRVVELGQQRAGLIESSCSVGDIHQEDRMPALKTSLDTVGFGDEPPKSKNRSLLELRRGPHAALVLNLHSGASIPSPARKMMTGITGSTNEDDNRLLFAEQPQTCYSTFGHESSLCATGKAVAIPPTVLTTNANLSSRPKTGEEPSKIADRLTLRMATLPLTGEALEAKLSYGGEDRLYNEFWDIPMNFANKADCPWVGVGQKNRYHEVLPHNSTRVVLPAINNDEMTSYINANYIHGYQGRPRAFIATQGPMSHTVNDFWRMVWHTRAPAVVMLTKICEEDKRSKCELYLPTSKRDSSGRALNSSVRADTVPDPSETSLGETKPTGHLLQSANSLPSPVSAPSVEGVASWGEEFSRTCSPVGSQRMFGSIHVRVIAVTQKKGYTERKLLLRMDGEERRVTHFWYVGWSDHSSPEATVESARSLLELVQETEACRHQNGGSSLPSTPVTMMVPTPNSSLSPPPRPLSRQAAEEWSDADFDLRFSKSIQCESPPTTALDHFSLDDSSRSASDQVSDASLLNLRLSGPRGYRASDPAPVGKSSPSRPIVVHCSAGVGRTGCFIALCIGCEQICNEGKVDVLGIVSRLRLDRGGMVENSEQYTFLHAALCIFYALKNGRELPVLPAITNLRNQFTGPLR
ncbi:unnamed protein product [Mesocestoides corti]|uniref:protein-tyrosine-phosphatase n=1 Tax=Mesocestoides corti TaxID=53468 RepID=A0A0R3UGE4_MESCO|nr:unnamed protein product [Mesocestoides corti]